MTSRRYSKFIELVERLFELGQQEGRCRWAITGQALEMPVQLGFQTGRVDAVDPALLDSIAQRREQSLEIRRIRVGRGRGLLVGHAAECTLGRPPAQGRTAKSTAKLQPPRVGAESPARASPNAKT